MKLRPYQKTAIRKSIHALTRVDRVLLAMPTASGKTVVASNICRMFQPVLWMAHQKELLSQAEAALLSYGIKADLISVFSSNIPNKHYKLLVIDEFHHEACDSYINILDRLNYDKLIGITATPGRLDKLRLRFDLVVDAVDQNDLVRQGFLVPTKLYRVRSLGRYIDDLVEWSNTNRHHIGKTIFFTASLAVAKYVQNRLHMSSEIISGSSARDGQLEQFRDPDGIQCLISCLILTEGVDLPICQTVVLGRPTKSRTLLNQMIGRGMRLYAGKHYCNVVEPVHLCKANNYVKASTIIDPVEELVATPTSILNNY